MHPIEHLRYVARADGADPALIAREAAAALGEMARTEFASLVPACKRLIDRHPTCAPLWWLSARLLGADEPGPAAYEAARELDEDRTDRHLVAELPDSATAVVIGWPDVTYAALRSRGDVEVLAVDSRGEAEPMVRRLDKSGGDAVAVPESGVGAAAAVADLVIVEALAAGPPGVLAAPGSLAAAAVAVHSQVPVWVVAGVGRVLPERLWDALVARLDGSGVEPWERPAELVPVSLISRVIGPAGAAETAEGLATTTCPAAPELFRASG